MFKIYLKNASDILPKQLHSKEISNMSHHNTLLSQTLSLIPRHIFQKLEALTCRCSSDQLILGGDSWV